MNIAIIGHSKGLGKYLFDKLSQEHNVKGFARSNNYNLETDLEIICAECLDTDLVIINASFLDAKRQIVNRLKDNVKNIVVMSSSNSDYLPPEISPMIQENLECVNFCRKVAIHYDCNILNVKISFLENTKDSPNRINSDWVLSYAEIYNVIVFWLENKNITEVTFGFKITPFIRTELERLAMDSYI